MSQSVEPRYPMRLVMSRTGLSADTLRAWERRHGAVRPRRSAGKQRLYSDSDIERLSLMHQLTRQGHSIGEIARLSAAALASLLDDPPAAAAQPDVTDAIVQQAMASAELMNSQALETLLRRAALTHGSEVLLDRILPKFLRAIGKRWHAGEISVAHEHHATATVRRVIDWTTDAWAPALSAPKLVVATPPGELHELGALLASAAAMSEGWRVIYLGANMPADLLLNAAHRVGARAIALSLVYGRGRAEKDAVLQVLRGVAPQVEVLVGGEGAAKHRAAFRKAGARLLPDFASFRRALRSLRSSELEPTRDAG